jgi:hypothetical protein
MLQPLTRCLALAAVAAVALLGIPRAALANLLWADLAKVPR